MYATRSMPLSMNSAQSAYRENSVATASPARLLVMLVENELGDVHGRSLRDRCRVNRAAVPRFRQTATGALMCGCAT